MSESKNSQTPNESLRNMSRVNAAELVANTAMATKAAGHDWLIVRHAKVAGQQGILVFLPGFEITDGRLQALTTPPVPAAEPV